MCSTEICQSCSYSLAAGARLLLSSSICSVLPTFRILTNSIPFLPSQRFSRAQTRNEYLDLARKEK